MKIILRPMVKEDGPFIYATWLRSQRYGNAWFKSIDQDVYYDGYKKVISHRLTRSEVVVGALESDPDVVVGYSVFEGGTLHYLYVKRAWRRLGLAKQMVPDGITQVSSLTKIGNYLKPKGWKFNPFL